MRQLEDGNDGVPLASPQPWEQQAGESSKAYSAFAMYLAQGPERSLHGVASQCTKSESLVRRWSSRWGWRGRAELFDRSEARAIHKKLVAKLATLRSQDLKMAASLDQKTALRLDLMTADEVDALSPMELLAFIRTSSDLKYKAAEISDAEACFPSDLPAPQFTIQVITPGCDPEGNRMIGVQLTSGEHAGCYGYIPRSRIDDFKRDYPDARVLI